MRSPLAALLRTAAILILPLAAVLVCAAIGIHFLFRCDAEIISADQDFLVIALMAQAKSSYLDIPVTQSGAESFLKKNPGCCVISRNSPSTLERILRLEPDVEVRIRHSMSAQAKSKFGGEYYEAFIIISKCGIVYERFGQQIDNPNK